MLNTKLKIPYITNLLELSTILEYIMNNGEIVRPIKIWNKRTKPKNTDLFFEGINEKFENKFYNIHDIICEISHPSVYIQRGGEKIFVIDENGKKIIIK